MKMTVFLLFVKLSLLNFNMFCWQQYFLSQDPALRLRLPSSLPGYDDYEKMVNDDEFAVYCLCVGVFYVYVSVFVSAFILDYTQGCRP